ncbi:hypothetical protein [Neisseria shayeganii]|nr:hypothetical protein [Neisseria shayeganii]
MNDWVKKFIAEMEAAARQEMLRRELLMHYALMFEQQVMIGNMLSSHPDEATENLLDEATEKDCLKAALLVRNIMCNQGVDEMRALILAAKLNLKHKLEGEHGQH